MVMSWWKRLERVLRTLTSQDLRWGSKEEKGSFLEAEKDLVRRSSGRGGGRKRALRAAAVEAGFQDEEEEEAVEGLLLGSKRARRSQRHEGQKPVKASSGWRGQEVEGRWGCGGWGGFITGSGGDWRFEVWTCYEKRNE